MTIVGLGRRLGAFVALVALPLLVAAGCSIDRELVDSLEFKCFDDSDCLVGYLCIGAGDGVEGVCQQFEDPDAGGCADRDQDGFPAGDSCPVGTIQDCNDNDRLINPSRDETCDNVDQNCNGDIDENIPAAPCDLQVGVCAGATRECVNGAMQDCVAEGLYGPDFELVNEAGESCDNLDNNCNGTSDGACECVPGITPPRECGTEIGTCTRGIQFCQNDGTFTGCVEATLGDNCVDNASCGANGFCIDERIDFFEDLFDDCILNSDPDCFRSVCRTLVGTTACTGDGECGGNQVCVEGSCQNVVQGNVAETCNGLDDDCNRRIDDGNVCQPCPFGSVLVENVPTAPQGLCMDKYEASRPDATAGDDGSVTLYATSREGVMPWTGVDTAAADEACRATAINEIQNGAVTQRFLCQGEALAVACMDDYPYGDSFQADFCNDATSDDGLAATGSFPNCCVQVGATAEEVVCDLSGNAAEVVINPFSGGFGGHADTDQADELTCEVFDFADIPNDLRGFRCCAPPRF